MQLSAEVKGEIRKEVKKEELVCPEGDPQHAEHEWESEPREPEGSTREAIEILTQSGNDGERFEGVAAQRNVLDGDLTIPAWDRRSKVSREPTDEELEAGASGEDFKVFRHCKRPGCGHKAEVDHTTNDGQAECKNVGRFDSDKQLRRNRSIQRQTGSELVYKINDGKNADFVESQLEYAAKVGGVRMTIKRVIMT